MKYKVFTPVEGYTGISASLPFLKGEAETADEKLVAWFKKHGYTVIPAQEPEPAKPKTTKKGGPKK